MRGRLHDIEALRGLVVIPNVDHHVVLEDDGKMWNVFLDGELVYILPPGCLSVLGQCLKCLLLGFDGRAMVEAPFFMVPILFSVEPSGVWAEVAQLVDEGEHQLVINYEFVVDN